MVHWPHWPWSTQAHSSTVLESCQPSLPKADYCILGRTDSHSSAAPATVRNHSRPGWTLLSSSPPLPAPGSSHPPPTCEQEQPSLAPPTAASPSPHPTPLRQASTTSRSQALFPPIRTTRGQSAPASECPGRASSPLLLV